MTREEQIIAEAKKYYSDSINCHNAFLHGVEWADEHPVDIWHDVSEEPNIDEDVVLYDSCGNFVTEFYNGDVTWNNIVVFHKATIWAYINDLLLKGGER